MLTPAERLEREAERLRHLDQLRAEQRRNLARALLVAHRDTAGLTISEAARRAGISRVNAYELLRLELHADDTCATCGREHDPDAPTTN